MPNRLSAFTLTALIVREKGSKEETFHIGWDLSSYKDPKSALDALLVFVNGEFGTNYQIRDLDDIDPDFN